MPCLNEGRTVGACVDAARAALAEAGIKGEVVVADNGSTDGSIEVAARHGARIVEAETRGYGAAVCAGIQASRGRFIIMGDADGSYDWSNIQPFVEALRDGADLVVGNRFRGGIEPRAMPALHRYFGNPVLSFIGRLCSGAKVGDFHCGLRAFTKDAALRMNLQTTGMELASEMIVKATLLELRVCEIPTTLRPDGRDRPAHLRPWRDGWRHLRFLLVFGLKPPRRRL